jgi:hypothetical protein
VRGRARRGALRQAVVTHRDDNASWLEQDLAEEARERFGVPVTRLTV